MEDEREAHVEVICPGMLEVLSVGKGDIKLTVGGSDPAEIEKARAIIEEMLRKGYSIFVETDKGVRRVKKFNPKRMTYIISEVVEATPEPAEPKGRRSSATWPEWASGSQPGSRARKVVERQVPVAGSRAKAVGRTAGG